MSADLSLRPARERIRPRRGSSGTARQPGSLLALPRGASVALRDPAPPRSSASPVHHSGARRLCGKVGYREQARPHKRLMPSVEGMDSRLLMTAGVHATAAQIASRIGPTVQHWMTQDHIPGMGVAVTYRGRVLLTKGYGLADLATGTPVTA